jgi:hypothetical protein
VLPSAGSCRPCSHGSELKPIIWHSYIYTNILQMGEHERYKFHWSLNVWKCSWAMYLNQQPWSCIPRVQKSQPQKHTYPDVFHFKP